jgi:hypothetical protein
LRLSAANWIKLTSSKLTTFSLEEFVLHGRRNSSAKNTMQLRKRKNSRLLQTCKEKKKQKNQLSILLKRHTEKHNNNNNNNNPTKDSIFCSNPSSKTGTKLKSILGSFDTNEIIWKSMMG